ncbi:MAG: glyoxalase/bleomycin resistance/extradiol dioxygenase family protein [Myxococcales bacterium]|nr:glyoxalase/bleomycin resistance/extradiol dioxygenase family protein [Myxococcales bacterium]
MANIQITPYLFFSGTASAAIEFYCKALGAEVDDLRRYGDLPDLSPENRERVMHATLRVGGAKLMISDVTVERGPASTQSNVDVLLDFEDPEAMARAFDALAEGGEVGAALHDTFWGARFGMLRDRYNINWMFHHTLTAS